MAGAKRRVVQGKILQLASNTVLVLLLLLLLFMDTEIFRYLYCLLHPWATTSEHKRRTFYL